MASKQEQTDFACDSDIPGYVFRYLHTEGLPDPLQVVGPWALAGRNLGDQSQVVSASTLRSWKETSSRTGWSIPRETTLPAPVPHRVAVSDGPAR